jgi:hypothetical protein
MGDNMIILQTDGIEECYSTFLLFLLLLLPSLLSPLPSSNQCSNFLLTLLTEVGFQLLSKFHF